MANNNFEPCSCPECLEFDDLTGHMTDEEFYGDDEPERVEEKQK